ncbi:putative inhibitor of growth histone-binding protein [Dioscorea sansibarensis]
MVIARTRVFVDDYLEYSSTLAAELQWLLSTMRELDERAQGIISQTREQTNDCLGMHSHSSMKVIHDDDETTFVKTKNKIEATQENALSLCTGKVLLAWQAHDLEPGLVF